MYIVHSSKARTGTPTAKINSLLSAVSQVQLRSWVDKISVPRHHVCEASANREVARWIAEAFAGWGYRVEQQGSLRNIVALPAQPFQRMLLVGAHYDSVPYCPGADDNGSAVAALLMCAELCSWMKPSLPICFVAFNGEEDGLKGSIDFVGDYLAKVDFKIEVAHILEMVGYARYETGTQRVPPGLPVAIPDRGDFLGLLANRISGDELNNILQFARTYLSDFPVIGLNVSLGLERFFPVLQRSDHAPFWAHKIPAVMWTDTSEFRNPNYHRDCDTPDTIDYNFLANVTKVLVASVCDRAQTLSQNQ